MTPRVVLSGRVLECGAIGGIVAGWERFENDCDNSRDQKSTSRRADFHVSRSGASALIALHLDGSGRGPQNGGNRFFLFALKRPAEAPRGRRLQSNRMRFARFRRAEWPRNAMPSIRSIDSMDHMNKDALARRMFDFRHKNNEFLQ